jgi:hypothetical protein
MSFAQVVAGLELFRTVAPSDMPQDLVNNWFCAQIGAIQQYPSEWTICLLLSHDSLRPDHPLLTSLTTHLRVPLVWLNKAEELGARPRDTACIAAYSPSTLTDMDQAFDALQNNSSFPIFPFHLSVVPDACYAQDVEKFVAGCVSIYHEMQLKQVEKDQQEREQHQRDWQAFQKNQEAK